MMMHALLGLMVSLCPLWAQVCVPSRILPSGRGSGSLGDQSCWLSDGTVYDAWRLDLAVRGRLQVSLTSDSDFILILRGANGTAIDSGTAIDRPVEAGGYSLLVNGRTPGQVGNYTVETDFTAEPGMMCTAFPALGLNQTVTGAIGVSGCNATDGTAYEAYTLATFGAGTLTVSVSSTETNPLLTVRDDAGHVLASGSARLSVPVDGDSLYQVVVAAGGQSGPYQLVSAFEPDPDETCRARKRLSDSGADSDAAAITPDSCYSDSPGGDPVYYNYYGLSVSTPGLVDLSAQSTDFLPVLTLLDGSGETLATDSGGSAGGRSEILAWLPAGDYTVQVSSGTGGNYTFSYQTPPGGPPRCTAGAANPGDALAGSLSASSCRTTLGPADIYSFTLASAGTFTLDLNPAGFEGAIALRDSKDNLLVASQDLENAGVAHLAADLAPGTYTVVAAAASGSGPYQMTAAFAAHDIPPCTYIQPLALDGGYIQKLRPGSCRDGDGQPVDFYEFTLPSDGVALAIMTSSEIDGLLRLLDANGNVLRTDDNSYARNDPMIVQFLPAGTYRLAARAASWTDGGYYQVDLRTALGPRPPFCSPKAVLTPATPVTATLTFTGCQYPDGTFADLYRIDLASAATVSLSLSSADFDAFLQVLDGAGSVVAEDDNSGGGTDAALTVSLPAGTYFAVAKPSAGYHIGAYQLRLALQ